MQVRCRNTAVHKEAGLPATEVIKNENTYFAGQQRAQELGREGHPQCVFGIEQLGIKLTELLSDLLKVFLPSFKDQVCTDDGK